MNTMNPRFRATWVCSATAALTTFCGSGALAAPLDLSDVPLFLTSGVQPNLIMAIDDSGSMDFEVLFAGNDGSAWWRTANSSGNCPAASGNSFIGCIADGTTDLVATGHLNFNNSGNSGGTWKKYSYLFPNGCDSSTDSWRRRLCDNNNDHFAIAPIPEYAWARSSAHNAAYFDPTVTYLPWRSEGGFTFNNANPTAAPFDPVYGGSIDLTRDRASDNSVLTSAACTNGGIGGSSDNHVFKVYTGMVIPAGSCVRVQNAGGSSVDDNWALLPSSVQVGVTTGNHAIPNAARVAIRYFPATFYLPTSSPPPSSFGYTGAVLSGSAPNGSVLQGYEIKPGNFASSAHYNAAIQNFANWFTYYRKRHQALRAGLGEAFFDLTGMRIAGFTINNNGADVTMRSIDVPSNRTNLYAQFYDEWVRSGGTPNRAAVHNIARNFRRTGSNAPIEYACQKNFGMLFTDGFSNPPANGDGFHNVGNVDSGLGDPYQDNVSNTMADGVMQAYLNPLRNDLALNKVTVPTACTAPSPDPRLDCNNDLHMNFFAVTLGTRGLQFDPDVEPPVDPYVNVPIWPTAFPARHPSAVDDIWHATINGRGQLLNARSPREISEKLKAVLRSIVERTGSASSASVNSGSISSETRLYQAKFDSRDWSGQLLAYRINEDGTLGSQQWDAADQIPVPNSRKILTVNSNGSAVPFRWASLDATRQSQLDADAAIAEDRLNYLRGDASNEKPNGRGFRARVKKLGDIVASSPMFVGKPRLSYSDALENDPYSDFKVDNENRDHVVYIGANDGMVHAFDAANGRELLAFVPSAAYRNLRTLSDPNYSHRYFVDGAPNAGDAYFNGRWHSVLVGGLNRGGQGIYALDITDPDDFSEANASSLVMWEFTDADDADLGYTYAQPAIVRLHNGRWAAVFGNGYNNTEADGRQSSTGNAVLFVVDIEDGTLIRKLDTGIGRADDPTGLDRPNGMSTPTLVDFNGDSIVDFAYAGDLFGNMWKFDLRGANESNWKFSFGTSANPQPIFSARDPADSSKLQPITSRPEIIRGPRGIGLMVLFGTGKYIENDDKIVSVADPNVQTYYGLLDHNAHNSSGEQLAGNRIAGLAELQQQTILSEPSVTFGSKTVKLRLTSKNPLGTFKGWYLNLRSPDGYQGERQVSNTLVRAGRVIFTTLIPDNDPCGFGGSSWLMELDALSGGRLQDTPFDLNNDGVFDEDDFAALPGGGMGAASGVQLEVGIAPEPGILMTADGKKEVKYNPGTTGEIAVTDESPPPKLNKRQSWRQIR